MPSFKSHVVSFVLRHSRKQAFSSPENLQRWIAYARKTEDHHPPASLRTRFDIAERMVNGFPVYEIAPRTGERKRMLYLHGGAFVFQITSYHWGLIAEMAERLGFGITVPIYPIAPEHDFHAMFGMVGKVYRQMLEDTEAADIVFMGDSAGGNMAVVLTMMAAEDALPLPSHHVLISPGLDMSLSNPEVFEAERNDPWLGIAGGLEAIRLYSAGIDRADWHISPLYGDLSVLPKTLLLTGSHDLLTPDNLIFAEKARAAGVEVEVVYEEGMFHVWPLIEMPETRRARNSIVAFLTGETRTRPVKARGWSLEGHAAT
ncbi:alpha/beta hydrolase [Mesorhizobium sp. M4B.F.Ca.ET.215.01.1.1]|uniref:alpha/beta hydrolase fold domain-containing protein n=1 Tax=unclassified Mesorhizobium TaxID=325217 RepID=UPI000FCB3711|nr:MULTISPECIES: alpha/beta hydrolase [unclassified Mesorhizobium]RUW22389.1 alpha/beta hydrolase [Mesorhizobium sp. M4B.F.Ca.ET.013.02.1.1]RVD36764.1 alpha/beta hydrolase [Mesorhizobium sp. M4B.F.Ca.ET.019.03.1.1]RWF64888.1 MAG: alpha/beta hydrolase [Mesorhizobium sp.]TGQ11317.1 alpha/beta hydrolase [Mesorhizobium sp. M4B.F.Ca.ET.215.01.1.1]TGQ28250.1 alpha/beta hydrolase [Mesorhizobium sp. M4B.F.Ca.ET.214.01.1.1]